MTERARRSQRATPKVQRWTDLLASLLRHRWPIDFEAIAREVPAYCGKEKDAAKRMFERDKRELLQFGVPLETVPDDTGEPTLYRLRPTGFYLPYLAMLGASGASGAAAAPRRGRVDRYGYKALQTLAFEPDELAAVADAAARAASLGDPLLAADAESALRKLAHDLPLAAAAAPDLPHVVPPRAQPPAEVFATLGEALRDRKRVTFAYRVVATGESERREAEPYGLFHVSGHWYLAARDRGRGALRNFRLSRMSDVARNARAESTPDYDVPADFRLRDHARSRHAWELGDGDAIAVDVAFARDRGDARGAASLGEPVDGDATVRRFAVRRPDAFARWLLALAGDARPVSPPEFVARWTALLQATAATYAGEADA